ncbi:phosphoribosyltransferase family protein [Flavobacterium sp.]|uniref:phosphoribosyltransferase family protein n=1 Tax=Flavobacterium sp. TaxID=239 RepID=UPI003751689C
MKNIILTNEEIEHKIKRIAFQIYETFVDDKSIILAGIALNGFLIAEKIATILNEISTLDVVLCKVEINKKNVFETVTTSIDKELYSNKGVVLVDDVLNSGTTLMYCVKHFLEVPVTKLKTTVLVDRNHKKFPVKVDFKGISLSTSSNEHVTIVFENDTCFAYLE